MRRIWSRSGRRISRLQRCRMDFFEGSVCSAECMRSQGNWWIQKNGRGTERAANFPPATCGGRSSVPVKGIVNERVGAQCNMPRAGAGLRRRNAVASPMLGRIESLVAEQIRKAILGLGMPHPTSPAGVQTVSVGVAALLPAPEHGATHLLRLADQALYTSKHGGRNCVSSA
jgi:hypothetical protein